MMQGIRRISQGQQVEHDDTFSTPKEVGEISP